MERGRWQEAVGRLAAEGKRFDAIFYDTYAEHYRDMQVKASVCVCVWIGVYMRAFVSSGRRSISLTTYTAIKPTTPQAFHDWLPKLLRKGGQYSFFNGLSPDNIFFHAVTCQVLLSMLSVSLWVGVGAGPKRFQLRWSRP